MNSAQDTTETLWTIDDVADFLGIKTVSAKSWLHRHHIRAYRTTPGNEALLSGDTIRTALYDPEPIRTTRTEQLRKAHARATMRHWVRWP